MFLKKKKRYWNWKNWIREKNNERVDTKEKSDLLDLLRKWIKKYRLLLKINHRNISTEKKVRYGSSGNNNATIQTDFGCVATKEIRSGEEVTYEYNWVESSE